MKLFKYIIIIALYLNWKCRQSGTRAEQQIAHMTLATQNSPQGKSWARYLKYAEAWFNNR